MTPEPRPNHVFTRPTPERLALLTALLVPALLLLIDGGRYAGLGAGLAASLLLAGFINRTGVFHPEEKVSWSPDPLVNTASESAGNDISFSPKNSA